MSILQRENGGLKLFVGWIVDQIINFNVLIFIAIVIFNTAMSKSTMKKLLKEQSQELYNEVEELKDEIRGNAK
jgi:large-conductance mechanosensitive channel